MCIMKHLLPSIFFCLLFFFGSDTSIGAKPVVVFAHGLGENARICRDTVIRDLFSDIPSFGHTGPEALERRFVMENIVFGQEDDIAQVIKACDDALQQYSDARIVAFGVSKGASTWLNTLAYLNKHSHHESYKKILLHIHAVVVVAPFADLFESEILTGLLGPLSPLVRRLVVKDCFNLSRRLTGYGIRFLFPRYDVHGMHPITSVPDIPVHIPLFIAHSIDDGLIPVKHSRMIYSALLKNVERRNLNNTYFVECNAGGHCDSIYNMTHDGNRVPWHAPMYHFLAQYGLLELHRTHGCLGADELRKYQPTRDDVEAKITKKRTSPTLAYALGTALSCEAVCFLRHVAMRTGKPYNSSWKRSLLLGLGVAASIEIINKIRARVS